MLQDEGRSPELPPLHLLSPLPRLIASTKHCTHRCLRYPHSRSEDCTALSVWHYWIHQSVQILRSSIYQMQTPLLESTGGKHHQASEHYLRSLLALPAVVATAVRASSSFILRAASCDNAMNNQDHTECAAQYHNQIHRIRDRGLETEDERQRC